MKKEIFWIGSVDYAGYLLHVVSRTEQDVQRALFKTYRKQKERTTDFKTYIEFADYFGPWIQKATFDEVIWP